MLYTSGNTPPCTASSHIPSARQSQQVLLGPQADQVLAYLSWKLEDLPYISPSRHVPQLEEGDCYANNGNTNTQYAEDDREIDGLVDSIGL